MRWSWYLFVCITDGPRDPMSCKSGVNDRKITLTTFLRSLVAAGMGFAPSDVKPPRWLLLVRPTKRWLSFYMLKGAISPNNTGSKVQHWLGLVDGLAGTELDPLCSLAAKNSNIMSPVERLGSRHRPWQRTRRHHVSTLPLLTVRYARSRCWWAQSVTQRASPPLNALIDTVLDLTQILTNCPATLRTSRL